VIVLSKKILDILAMDWYLDSKCSVCKGIDGIFGINSAYWRPVFLLESAARRKEVNRQKEEPEIIR
jgi:hypothetical protein